MPRLPGHFLLQLGDRCCALATHFSVTFNIISPYEKPLVHINRQTSHITW